MKIPFVDLHTQQKEIRAQIFEGWAKVLDRCNFILGDEVQKFEQDFAAYSGSRYALGLASGLDAIHLALRALGIGPGDEVIVQANTFIASTLGVCMAGAKPVLVDVDPATFLADPKAIEKVITPRTKAIMPVHLYGRLYDWKPLQALAEKHKLAIVEDAAQAHGATLHGKKAGSIGKIACFSFYPGKNLGAYGDGGAITTDDLELKQTIEGLRNYGSTKKYHHPTIGFNSRLDTMQAVVLNAKLPHLDSYNRRRYEAAVEYNKCLEGIGDIVLPQIPQAGSHIFHLYVVRTKSRDKLLEFLGSQGVGCVIHYPTPIHLHGAHANLGYKKGDFPVSEQLSQEILSLPMFPEITREQIHYTCDKVKEFFR